MIDQEFFIRIRGFMQDDEAGRLYAVSLEAAARGALLEVGSYCGKSAYVIGSACRKKQSILYSIDHHRGSEEQQPGEEYFDPELLDEQTARIDTLPFFRNMIEQAGLEDTVVPIVSTSQTAGRMWQTPLAMVFIDGGHAHETVLSDYRTWARHVMPGGFLVFHDIFLDPNQGGQAPRRVYETAVSSGMFSPLEMTRTLGVLKKISGRNS